MKVYSVVASGTTSGLPKTKSNTIVTIAAGSAIAKFALNLSFISTLWVLVAAMVVSEIMDKLSPNIEPQIVAATTKNSLPPPASARPSAIGVTATTVPTDVPVESAINAEITNTPAATN